MVANLLIPPSPELPTDSEDKEETDKEKAKEAPKSSKFKKEAKEKGVNELSQEATLAAPK